MTSFRQLMERESFTELECFAKKNSNLYVVLGKTGDIITNSSVNESIDNAVKRVLGEPDVPTLEPIERWLRTDPSRSFCLTLKYESFVIDSNKGDVTVSITSPEGDHAYTLALERIKAL